MTYNRISTKILSYNKYFAVSIRSDPENRPFTKFMITAESSGDDNQSDNLRPQKADVGFLKPLQEEQVATYSETCLNTVKNIDNSPKKAVTVSSCATKGCA